MTEYEIHKIIEQQNTETKQRIWAKIQSKLQEEQHKMKVKITLKNGAKYEYRIHSADDVTILSKTINIVDTDEDAHIFWRNEIKDYQITD